MNVMHGNVAMLAVNQPVNAQGEAQLLPFGRFAARDGRPGPGATWEVTDRQGAVLCADMNSKAVRTPIVIDYDHQTISALTNGQPAPAAGWVKSTKWRDGIGLFADVNWTARAKSFIAALEYRFISPVITYDQAGTVTQVLMASLVNLPALTGMSPVLTGLSAEFLRGNQTVQRDEELLKGFEGNPGMTFNQRQNFLNTFGHTPAELRKLFPAQDA